jgi:hypothetical protein
MEHDRAMRAGFDTVIALGAPLEEQRLPDGAGRPQPVRPRGSSGLLRRRIHVRGVFLRRFGDREHGILEKIPSPVFRLSSHEDQSQISDLKSQIKEISNLNVEI